MIRSRSTSFLSRVLAALDAGNVEDAKARLVNRIYMTERHNSTIQCAHCGSGDSLELYTVDNSVWASVAEKKDLLHLACLEQRLGRTLNLSDFPDLPVNKVIRWAMVRGK